MGYRKYIIFHPLDWDAFLERFEARGAQGFFWLRRTQPVGYLCFTPLRPLHPLRPLRPLRPVSNDLILTAGLRPAGDFSTGRVPACPSKHGWEEVVSIAYLLR